jgi:hypothetical protein
MTVIVRVVLAALCVAATAAMVACGGGSQPVIPPLTITTGALPNGILGTPYNQPLTASGGTAPYRWTVSSGALPHNLAMSSSQTSSVMISGTPDRAAQGVAFTIEVTDSGNQSARQAYTVSVLATEILMLSPDGLDFGIQIVGVASQKQSETLTNTGGAALTISSITIGGSGAGDYIKSDTCGSSLAGGANCTIDVIFTPGQLGPRTASISITDDDVGSPQTFPVTGVGANRGSNATLSGGSLTFGSQVIGTTSSSQSVTLTNYGTTTLNLTSIAASADFVETHTCGSKLPSGGACTIDVAFAPTSSGSVNGTLAVTDDATDSPQSLSLSGTGKAGRCSPKGLECGGPLPSCCSGLVCRQLGLRGFCEP